MQDTWSLDIYYKGYEDERFQKDLARCREIVHELADAMERVKGEPHKAGLEKVILAREAYQNAVNRVGEYVFFRQATDTTDSETVSYVNEVEKIRASSASLDAALGKVVASFSEEKLKEMEQESEILGAYTFYLANMREQAKHSFSEEMEGMIAKMNLSGANAWSRLFDYLTSTLKVDYEGKELTLSKVRNLAYAPEPEVREAAYQAELAAYEKVEAPIAFALNNIKNQVTMLSRARGYESPLQMTLAESHMKQETLDAMLTAIREYLPVFHQYLKEKASFLGRKGSLPWFDLFAPVGKSEKKYTLEEAKDCLVNSFQDFSQEAADMIERAFDENWIDFYPRQGEVGGAFCSEVTHAKQSRILTNFSGTFESVDTLAHELGHAFHSQQIFDHRILNQLYPMQVAETASTFNETHITKRAIAHATGQERMSLLESFVSNTTQTICDIYSRFLFEDTVFGRCEKEFLMPEELKTIMLNAQKEAYGDGLDADYLHPYMWACKGHYYIDNLSYYNFPYAFGAMFAMGLYTQFEKEGADFVPKYKALLHATSVTSVEETGKMADIDITKPDFWRDSLSSFEKMIKELLEIWKSC